MTAAAPAICRIKRNGGKNEEADEIEELTRLPRHQTRRIAIHSALRCSDQHQDDPAPESAREGVKHLTPPLKKSCSCLADAYSCAACGTARTGLSWHGWRLGWPEQWSC